MSDALKPNARQDPADEGVGEQKFEAFVRLGQQLAARAARANFQVVSVRSNWTRADVEAETERAIERMWIGSHDLMAASGADPDDADWRMAWIAMEIRYRETMAELLSVSGPRVEENLQ